ncbi:hypothetical protein DBT53_004440, partial [Aerococcus mictus]|uniref:hypothetical protein n=1 Tax=Aerococcus mictus TaxID=2976810 RepID=UPI002FCFB8B6
PSDTRFGREVQKFRRHAAFIERAQHRARLHSLRAESCWPPAHRIIGDFGGEPLAVFGKAAGLTRKEFGDLIVAAAEIRSAGLPARADLERITSVFDAISTDRADHVLHCWDWTISSEAQFTSLPEI